MPDGNHNIDVPAISRDPRLSGICTTKVIQLQMMFMNHTDRDIQGRLGILLRAYDGRLFKLSCCWFISRGMEL